MLRGIARFADVGLQYLGVAKDNQTGSIPEGREPVMF